MLLTHLGNLVVTILDLPLLLCDQFYHLLHLHGFLVFFLLLEDLRLLNFFKELVCTDLPLGITLSQFINPLLLIFFGSLELKHPGIEALDFLFILSELIRRFIAIPLRFYLLLALQFFNFDAKIVIQLLIVFNSVVGRLEFFRILLRQKLMLSTLSLQVGNSLLSVLDFALHHLNTVVSFVQLLLCHRFLLVDGLQAVEDVFAF